MANFAEQQYLTIMHRLMTEGNYREGRNGATYSLFGQQMRFDLSEGFPLLTTKKVFTKGIIVELLWMIKGLTNIEYLQKHGVHIWDEWADADGNLGPVYGKQWRQFAGVRSADIGADSKSYVTIVDQLVKVILGIKSDPYGRRHIITAWNPAEIEDMALPPCHCFMQFHVADGKLNCQLYQRSADWFLGVPFNIASYALLTTLIARECQLVPGEFVHTFGDYHLYANHLNAAKEQLSRTPTKFPWIRIRGEALNKSIFELEPTDIDVVDYESADAIKAPVSV